MVVKLKDYIGSGIQPLDATALERARERMESLTMPQGSLGRLGEIAVRMSGITGQMPPVTGKKAIVVMAGDHGVCAEGVSAYPSSVTPQMVMNFLNGGAAVNVFAKHAGADVICVDMGVASHLSHPSLWNYKFGFGTKNIACEPAMLREEAEQAVIAGIQVVKRLVDAGYRLLAVGEMGIGNTTPAAAMTCALTGASPDEAVGRGTGVDDQGLLRKRMVVRKAIAVNDPDGNNALDVLAKLGGYEIAGMAGVCLGAAMYRVPLIIDGYITSVAALAAARLNPVAASYWFASHRSAESGHSIVLQALGLEPILELGMRLGEGTGAALCMRIVEAGADVLGSMATFESAGVSR